MSETIHHGDRHGHGDEHRTPDTGHIQNPDVQHEMSDVNVGAILKFIVALAIGTAIVFGIIGGMIKGFDYAMDKVDPQKQSPLALKEEERLPPEPRLQLAKGWQVEGQNLELREPQAESKILLEKWNNQLDKGGVDPQTGATLLPIEEAKRMIVQQNLPARQQQQQAGQTSTGKVINEGVAIPGGQSSGQQTESRDK